MHLVKMVVDGTMQIWILRYEEKRPMAIELRDANSFTTTLTMSSDGSVLVSGRSDGLVTIWRFLTSFFINLIKCDINVARLGIDTTYINI